MTLLVSAKSILSAAIPIIREELLFEKISVIIVNSGILNNSSQITIVHVSLLYKLQ